MNLSGNFNKSQMQNFYEEFGVKQYNSFSGGFRYLQKSQVVKPAQQKPVKKLSRQDLFREFGLTKNMPKTYKLDNQYVPDTKSQLADKLMQKIEHQRKKMRYYRQKYYGECVDKYEYKH